MCFLLTAVCLMMWKLLTGFGRFLIVSLAWRSSNFSELRIFLCWNKVFNIKLVWWCENKVFSHEQIGRGWSHRFNLVLMHELAYCWGGGRRRHTNPPHPCPTQIEPHRCHWGFWWKRLVQGQRLEAYAVWSGWYMGVGTVRIIIKHD